MFKGIKLKNLGFQIFIFSLPFLLIAISYFGFTHFKKWLKHWKLSRFKEKSILRLYGILIIAFTIPWFVKIVLGMKTSPMSSIEWRQIYLYPSYIWHLSHIAFFLIYLPVKIIQLIKWLYFKASKKIDEKPDFSKRNSLKKSGIVIPLGLLYFNTLSVYSTEYDHIINRLNIKINNIDENLKGLTITQISDIHFGTFMDIEKFSVFIKQINHLASDLIVITGDIINSSSKLIPEVAQAFLKLKAPLGVYCCLGNHEYYTGEMMLKTAFKQVGIPTLVNDKIKITANEKDFYLMGIDYPIYSHNKKDQLEAIELSLKQLNSHNIEIPKILLAHHPNTFLKSPDYNIDLTLSGHTHGGQIVLGEIDNKPIGLNSIAYPFVKGKYENNNSSLYVNSGLGHWLPLRYNCPAEITQITLI